MSYTDFRRGGRPRELAPPPVSRSAAVASLLVMAGIVASVIWLASPVIAHVWDLFT